MSPSDLLSFSRLRPTGALATGLVMLLGLAACGRPFVEEARPEVRVVAPDLSLILTDDVTTIEVEVESFRAIDSVLVRGQALTYDPQTERWSGAIRLRPGLNALSLSAVDAAGTSSADTAYALYLPASLNPAVPVLPQERGGHTATLLRDGSLLVTGGAQGVGYDASSRAFLLPDDATDFETLSARMNEPRIWHTASMLPDGRVLILGGSTRYDVGAIRELAASVEIYDPATGRFTIVPYDGPPIRRARHTASVRRTAGGVLIDLYGGVGDVSYGDDPSLGLRGDLGVYEFRDDSLFARSPAPGFRLRNAEPVSGHTQTPLAAPLLQAPARYLVAGARFRDETADPLSFIIDFTHPDGLDVHAMSAAPTPRTLHAAELLRNGQIFFFGGMRGHPGSALAAPELYVEEADRFFRWPEMRLLKRFGHTATKTGPRRILLVGGFTQFGNGLPITETFVTAF